MVILSGKQDYAEICTHLFLNICVTDCTNIYCKPYKTILQNCSTTQHTLATMSHYSYYDDFTGITHYENFYVLRIEEIDTKKEVDTKCLIIYDHDDDHFYLYGSRKNHQHPNHCVYQKRFKYMNDLFRFLQLVMNLRVHKVNIMVHYLTYATSEDDFDSLIKHCADSNEITGYNNISINYLDELTKWFCALL
jgi:hypothetical protein